MAEKRLFSQRLVGAIAAFLFVAISFGQDSDHRFTRHLNIQYAEHRGVDANLNQLDVYVPVQGEDLPIMIFIHGGGWRRGDKSTGAHAKPDDFTSKGFILVCPNYRLSPAVQHPVHANDVAEAVRYVYDHAPKWKGDPSRIYLSGHSAGAHLAALVAIDGTYLEKVGLSTRAIRGVVAIDGGGYDIPALHDRPRGLSEVHRMAFSDSIDKQKQASPITHVAPGKYTPPFLFLQASGLVMREHAKRLSDKLRGASVHTVYAAFDEKTHRTINTELGTPNDKPTEAMWVFLNELEKKSPE